MQMFCGYIEFNVACTCTKYAYVDSCDRLKTHLSHINNLDVYFESIVTCVTYPHKLSDPTCILL